MQIHTKIITFCAISFILVSCSVKHPELPETPVLTKSPGWVLIIAKWVRLKEKPEEQARDIAFLRYRDMAQLQKRIYVPETERVWCEVAYELEGKIVSGWVEARDVLIVETKEQALTVLKEMQ